jgi:hypothetical protein
VLPENVVGNKYDIMLKNITVCLLFLFIGISAIQGQNNKKEALYVSDTSVSNVAWNCGPHYGCVQLDSGYLNVIDNKIVNGKFVIDLSSLYVEDIEHELLRLTLANVIKSHEFFDAPNFPNFVFSIDKLEELSTNEYNVVGQLTLKG